jgi:hypothetical protein
MKQLLILVAGLALATASTQAQQPHKYYKCQFRVPGVSGQIFQEVYSDDGITQVKQILNAQYKGANSFQITGPFYK